MVDAIKAGREARSQAYQAVVLAKWAKALPRMFPAGTGKDESSVSSQALPSIWSDRAGFDRAAATYMDATAGLAALAASNDTPGCSKQLDAVDSACGACHPV